MEEFPFTIEDWERLREPASSIIYASFALNDETLRASAFVELQEVLNELRAMYGEHPVLLETEADFARVPELSIPLYRVAIELAVQHNLRTLSIRLALARTLGIIDQYDAAMHELTRCQGELLDASDDERESWTDQIAELAEQQEFLDILES
jgi:hypothetical protein